jgi:hypothetical protein
MLHQQNEILHPGSVSGYMDMERCVLFGDPVSTARSTVQQLDLKGRQLHQHHGHGASQCSQSNGD